MGLVFKKKPDSAAGKVENEEEKPNDVIPDATSEQRKTEESETNPTTNKPKFSFGNKSKITNPVPSKTPEQSEPKKENDPLANALDGLLGNVGGGDIKATKSTAKSVQQLEDLPDFDSQPLKYSPKQIEELDEAFTTLVNNMGDKDVVTMALQRTMQHLAENPEHSDILEAEDLGIIARSLRRSYSVRVARKQTANKKRTAKQEERDKISQNLDFIMKKEGLSLG